MKQMAELLESGVIKPYIPKTFPFKPVREAYLEQENVRTLGKL
jgi:NADPH:quinone reductase-like Zn-dependent oxidoreductase